MLSEKYTPTVDIDALVIDSLLTEYTKIKESLSAIGKDTHKVDIEVLTTMGRDLRSLEHVLQYYGVEVNEAHQLFIEG